MIDKSIPFHPLTLCKNNTKQFPEYRLPQGYTFAFYRPGDEWEWATLEYELGQFPTLERGIEWFHREFVDGHDLLPQDRMLFVKDGSSKIVATASLWNGMFLGQKHQKVHWIAVSDRCAGQGIAKALLTRILELYNELGYEGFLYLETGARYYPAIGIYEKFGFTPYQGTKSLSETMSDEEFHRQNEEAIAVARTMLDAYAKGKEGTHHE